jgi:RimJ/RimL family protein N-acetyltransferase
MIPPSIPTPRLTLLRLTDTTPGSQHIRFYHENWSDPDVTAWSMLGATSSLSESRDRLIDSLATTDIYFYSIFVKQDGSDSDDLGEHIGSVSLRRPTPAFTLPVPGDVVDSGKEVDVRMLGYALFKKGWGKGYATEAGRALLDAYAACVAEEKALGEKLFWVEACVDEGNPGSQAVVRKLGFRECGWNEVPRFWLNGEWRTGCWAYGMEV